MIIELQGFGPALAAGALMTVKLALSALCLGLALPWLSACQRGSGPNPEAAATVAVAATRPVDAVHVLRDRLRRDGVIL